MPQITLYGPTGPPVSYSFDSDAISIGRARANDLVIHDRSLSRLHAQLRRDPEAGWLLVDCGSSNGTRHNGAPVLRQVALNDGDEVLLGSTRLIFHDAFVPQHHDEHQHAETWTGPLDLDPVRLVGDSPPMQRVMSTIERAAPSDHTVLVLGENGTGKELVARLLHARSHRADGPFQVVNCPALPDALVEAELFGIERGVATGVEPRIGRFEAANGGTIFLDEVGDLSPAAQAKLLRVLQERQIERVGLREPIPVDVRVVAATHHDLAADGEAGRFRRDLYQRLKVLTIRLPLLSQRREDIPALVRHFLLESGRPENAITPQALELLERYSWPGNVRELEHAIDAATLLARGPSIDVADLPEEIRQLDGAWPGGALEQSRSLKHRLLEEDGDFWELVHRPFMERRLSREAVQKLVADARRELGSYRKVAERFGLADDYKRFMNFLNYHGLGGSPPR